MLDRGVIQDAVDQQRPVLHQSEHWRSPLFKEIPVIFYDLRPEFLAVGRQHSSLKSSALVAQRIANPYPPLVERI
jgi:hypothetical protein